MQVLIDFSSFVNTNFLNALASETLHITKEMNIDLPQNLKNYEEAHLLTLFEAATENTLKDIQAGDFHESINFNDFFLSNFSGQDMISIIGAQKLALLHFIPEYTSDSKLSIDIATGLDKYYIQKQKSVFKRLSESKANNNASPLVEDKKVRTLIDAAPDSIILMNEQFLIIGCNTKAELVFGWKKHEVINKKLSEIIIPAELMEAHEQDMEKYLHTSESTVMSKQLEITAIKKDRTEFPIELTISAANIETERLFIGFIRDISKRKIYEDNQNLLLKSVEKKNKELNDFAYIVSHDLKAPLRAIGSLTNWLMKDYGDKFDADGKQYIELLIGRVSRMDSLIDGILQYSRIGKTKEGEQDIDMRNLINEIISALAPPDSIKITMDENLPVLHAGKISMVQIFQNLISNAISYMDKPLGLIHIGCVEEDSQWIFMVKDNGPGIEEKYFEKIFQIFQSLKSRDESESTGIGLAIVKKTIESYGGKVWVESVFGSGSIFYIAFPKSNMDDALLSESTNGQAN